MVKHHRHSAGLLAASIRFQSEDRMIYSHPRTWLVGTGQAQRRRVKALGMQFDYNAKKAAYVRQHGLCKVRQVLEHDF